MLSDPAGSIQRIGRDVRWALRMLGRHRRFALVTTLPLILGVGVNTAIFTIFNAAVLRPLPVTAPDRVVRIYGDSRDAPRRKMFSFREYSDYRERSTVFSDLAAYADTALLLRESARASESASPIAPESVSGAYVSDNYLRLLSGTLAIGRWLPLDVTGDDVNSVVISERLWKRRFASAHDVLGRVIELNGVPVEIVGVTAEQFAGAEPSSPDVFLRLGSAARIEQQAAWLRDEASPGLRMIGRLRDGATLKEAEAVMSVLAQQRAAHNRAEQRGVRIAVVRASFMTMEPEILAGTGVILFVTGLVLLIACANAATLLLVRAGVRGKEIAIRLAIGASRRDLVRMLLTESVIVALASSGVALLLSSWSLKVLIASAMDARTLPDSFALNMMPDLRVLAYTSLVAVVTAVVCGLVPALRASRRDLVPALNDTGAMRPANSARWMNVLVSGQIAVSFMLLVLCGLLLRTEWKSQHVDIGFDIEHTADVYLDLAANGYNSARALETVNRLRERAESAAGVSGVSVAARPPLSNSFRAHVVIDPAAKPILVAYNVVDSEFLPVLRIPILRGRNVTAQRGGIPEVVISESLAALLQTSGDPLGRTLDLRLLTGPSLPAGGSTSQTVIVAGIARDTQRATLLLDPTPSYIYMPLMAGWTPLQTAVIVRSGARAGAAVAFLKAESRALNIAMHVAPRLLSDVLKERRRPVSIGAGLAALFGGLALLITLVGEYGLISYSVSQRTREIGIRIALGAQAATVARVVVRQGVLLVGSGVLAGTLISSIAGIALAKFLFHVSPFDPVTYVAVGLLFLLTGFLAIAAPIYKAATIDPVIALRQRT
jgi:predicted permease